MIQLSVVFYILKSSLSGINVDTLNYEFCGGSRFSRLILEQYIIVSFFYLYVETEPLMLSLLKQILEIPFSGDPSQIWKIVCL